MSHCSSLVPVEIYEVWPHMRDHARGTTPLAQFYLDEARRDMPPSKSHVKRLLKDRPRLTLHRPQPPKPSDGVREHYNQIIDCRDEVRRIMARSVHGIDQGLPHVPTKATWERKARPMPEPQPAKPLYPEPKPLYDPEHAAFVERRFRELFK